MHYPLDEKKLDAWAEMIVSHSLASQFSENGEKISGKKILLQGEICSESLLVRINNRLIDAGAFPLLRPYFSNVDRRNIFATNYALINGNLEQASYVPNAYKILFDEMDGFVYISGTEDINKLNGVNSNHLAHSRKAFHPLTENRLRKVWTLTQFPTFAESVFEGMDYESYADFIICSSIADYTKMKKEQEFLADELTKANNITLRTYNPLENRICELSMSKGDNLGLSCYGQANVPDGEVFTSPYAKTLQGEIFFDIPVFVNGLIDGVYLRFEDGVILDYAANKGYHGLKKIIETDVDSHKMGEFALGTNYNVTRNLKSILFAEKIGGTIHMAIGCSYEEPYGLDKICDENLREEKKNQLKLGGFYSDSAVHVDIPKDFRNPKVGEGVWFDGKELIWSNNLWNYK